MIFVIYTVVKDWWKTKQILRQTHYINFLLQSTIPETEFDKLTSETYVTIGGAAVFNLDVYIPYDSTADYKFEFYGDHGNPHQTTICEVRVVESGWNIPCMNGTFYETKYGSTMEDENTDMASLDVGAINNMQADLGLPLLSSKNRVSSFLLSIINALLIEKGLYYTSDSTWILQRLICWRIPPSPPRSLVINLRTFIGNA